MEKQDKTEAFASTFRSKWVLPEAEQASTAANSTLENGCFVPIRPKMSLECLKEIDPDSATGPDSIPSVVLKKMHMLLETPVTKIIRKIVAEDVWPELWKRHWIFPLLTKGLTSNSNHYRGIYLTSQV